MVSTVQFCPPPPQILLHLALSVPPNVGRRRQICALCRHPADVGLREGSRGRSFRAVGKGRLEGSTGRGCGGAEELGYALSCIFVVPGQHVRVDVEREGHSRVPETLRHQARVDSKGERKARVGVA